MPIKGRSPALYCLHYARERPLTARNDLPLTRSAPDVATPEPPTEHQPAVPQADPPAARRHRLLGGRVRRVRGTGDRQAAKASTGRSRDGHRPLTRDTLWDRDARLQRTAMSQRPQQRTATPLEGLRGQLDSPVVLTTSSTWTWAMILDSACSCRTAVMRSLAPGWPRAHLRDRPTTTTPPFNMISGGCPPRM